MFSIFYLLLNYKKLVIGCECFGILPESFPGGEISICYTHNKESGLWTRDKVSLTLVSYARRLLVYMNVCGHTMVNGVCTIAVN